MHRNRAMGCQKDVATTITSQNSDYVLALKRNQPELYQDVKDTGNGFANLKHDFYQTVAMVESRRGGVGQYQTPPT